MRKKPQINIREISENNKRTIEENNNVLVASSKTVINFNPRAKIPPAIMLFQTFAYLAATKLKPATNRVLNLLFSMTAFENFIGMDIKTIAEELEMTERSVISSLKELVDNNIIIKVDHPSDRRRNDYFINPTAAWKGNSIKRNKSIKAHDKNQLLLFGKEELK